MGSKAWNTPRHTELGKLKAQENLSEFRDGVVSEANAVLGSGAAFFSFEFASAINFQFAGKKKSTPLERSCNSEALSKCISNEALQLGRLSVARSFY